MFTDLLVPRGPRAHERAARPAMSSFGLVVFVLTTLSSIALQATSVQAASIYWTGLVYQTLERANLDGTGVQNMFVPASGVALDVAAGKMYTTKRDSATLERRTLNGAFERQFSLIGGPNFSDVALDATAGKLYWSNDFGIATGKFGPLGNALIQQTQIVQDLNVLGFGLDLTGGKIYYSADDEIRRANLDGTEQVAIATGLERAYAIALDLSAGKVYWSQNIPLHNNIAEIVRANLDGTGQEVIVAPSPTLIGFIPTYRLGCGRRKNVLESRFEHHASQPGRHGQRSIPFNL